MSRARKIAILITAVIAALLFLWLRLAHLHINMSTKEWPPRHDGEVLLAEEQFFDVVQDIPLPLKSSENPSKVHNETTESNASTPAPRSGDATVDKGKAADAPTTTTSKQPSPVKATAEEPTKSGPTQDELDAMREEEARRKANAAMNSAFNKSSGQDNTVNNGAKPGNSGSVTGTATGINGTGSGRVGGGWNMPSYAKVPATVTGSISLMVRIDKQGKVISVSFQGGDAPAATDARLRQAVENEVRSRRFTRGNSPAPDEATAYITYRFR